MSSRRDKRGRRRLLLNRNVFLALLAAILVTGIAKVSGPLATVRQQQHELARLRQEKEALLAEHRLLEAEKRRLATEEGQEWAARRRGYVRPGERRLVFSLDDTIESDEPAADGRPGVASEDR